MSQNTLNRLLLSTADPLLPTVYGFETLLMRFWNADFTTGKFTTLLTSIKFRWHPLTVASRELDDVRIEPDGLHALSDVIGILTIFFVPVGFDCMLCRYEKTLLGATGVFST